MGPRREGVSGVNARLGKEQCINGVRRERERERERIILF